MPKKNHDKLLKSYEEVMQAQQSAFIRLVPNIFHLNQNLIYPEIIIQLSMYPGIIDQ